MAQTKKDAVRDAILAAAFERFSEKGYSETTIPAIAAAAAISTANVYRYFSSKLEILYTLYEPWLLKRLERLGASLMKVPDPGQRLERLLLALWRDLPAETQGFANNVMQALSTSARGDDYDPRLRQRFQSRVASWLAETLELPTRDARVLAAVMLMAFDGFAMNVHLRHGIRCDARAARLVASLLMARTAGRSRGRRSASEARD